MSIPKLFTEECDWPPVARLFFLRYLMAFGGGEPVVLTKKEIAQKLLVSASAASTSISHLLRVGVLAREDFRTKGRSKNVYTLTEPHSFPSELSLETPFLGDITKLILSNIQDNKVTPSKMQSAAASLSEENGAKVGGNVTKLHLQYQVLLIALVCRADRMGVISEVSLKTLSRSTGMSTSSVRKGVQKLRSMDFMAQCVPGFVGKHFLGLKKGDYFLNHKTFECVLGEGLPFLSMIVETPSGHSFSKELFRRAKENESHFLLSYVIAKYSATDVNVSEALCDMLRETEDFRVVGCVQYILEKLAIDIVLQTQIERKSIENIKTSLLDSVHEYIFSGVKDDPDFSHSEARKQFVELIFLVAEKMALTYLPSRYWSDDVKILDISYIPPPRGSPDGIAVVRFHAEGTIKK